jgi:hypothetical protein
MDFPAPRACATSAASYLLLATLRTNRSATGRVRRADWAPAGIGGNADPTVLCREEFVSIANFQEAPR